MKSIILGILLLGSIITGYSQNSPKTAEDRATKVTEKLAIELALNEEQKKKVFEITLQQQKTKDQIFAKNSGNRELAKEELKSERKMYKDKFKAILTQEQLQKWEQEKKSQKISHQIGRGNNDDN